MLHHQATEGPTEERGISIPTDLERVPARALQGVIVRGRDRSPPAQDPLLDDVVMVGGIVWEGMEVGDAEARAIAAIAVMMTGAGADLGDEVEEVGVETIVGVHALQRRSLGGLENGGDQVLYQCTIFLYFHRRMITVRLDLSFRTGTNNS